MRKAIIHCAGRGTRLANVSGTLPKSMVSIDGKPALERQIMSLREHNIHELMITLHHLPEKITEYFGDGRQFGVSIKYFYEKELLGTGGALRNVSSHVGDTTLILYGDIVTNINFETLVEFHEKNSALITAVVHKTSHPEDSDLVIVDESDRMQQVLLRPHSTIPPSPKSLGGIYVFSREAFIDLPRSTPYSIERGLLQRLLKRGGKLFCYNTEEFMLDIGLPDRLAVARKILQK